MTDGDHHLPDPTSELVARYDAAGQVIGVADRGRVYREGLWHAGTGVLVRSGDGQAVYLHRRTSTKLLFPGHYDCWAGGVVGPGESPAGCAERELSEELGISGIPLVPLGRYAFSYRGPAAGAPAQPSVTTPPVPTSAPNSSTAAIVRYHSFLFEVRWDGPVRWQPEEVSWGMWVGVEQLRHVLADPHRWPFVPDGRDAVDRWLTGRLATTP